MNIILCSGDQIEGQVITIVEGKTIDMTTETKISDVSKVFHPGNKVHYTPRHLKNEAKTTHTSENGIVKRVTEAGVFVVYKCGGEWNNYQNYTAALTETEDLNHGWL